MAISDLELLQSSWGDLDQAGQCGALAAARRAAWEVDEDYSPLLHEAQQLPEGDPRRGAFRDQLSRQGDL